MAVLDSQSAKTSEAGSPSSYEAGKKAKDRKRHALVDTNSRLIKISVHPADLQDRDGEAGLLKASRASFAFVEMGFYTRRPSTESLNILIQSSNEGPELVIAYYKSFIS